MAETAIRQHACSCFDDPPAACPPPRLYIARALPAHNQRADAAFQNIIGSYGTHGLLFPPTPLPSGLVVVVLSSPRAPRTCRTEAPENPAEPRWPCSDGPRRPRIGEVRLPPWQARRPYHQSHRRGFSGALHRGSPREGSRSPTGRVV